MDNSSSDFDACQFGSLVKESSQKTTLKFSGTSSLKKMNENIDHNTGVVISMKPVEPESGNIRMFQLTDQNESTSPKNSRPPINKDRLQESQKAQSK